MCLEAGILLPLMDWALPKAFSSIREWRDYYQEDCTYQRCWRSPGWNLGRYLLKRNCYSVSWLSFIQGIFRTD
eukprot:c23154_g1_i1 orf=71-289(+)